jgi:hypothetical protein
MLRKKLNIPGAPAGALETARKQNIFDQNERTVKAETKIGYKKKRKY